MIALICSRCAYTRPHWHCTCGLRELAETVCEFCDEERPS